MLEPWAPINGYDVSGTGGVDPFGQMGNAGGMMPGMGGGMGGLMQALQGVKAPAAPTPQRVATPSIPTAPAPRAPTPVRGDQFMQLIQMLGNGAGAAAPQMPSVQPRLQQALMGR